MKKNYFKTAKVFGLGAIAMTTVALTSCNDDRDEFIANNATVSSTQQDATKTVSAMEGNFSGTAYMMSKTMQFKIYNEGEMLKIEAYDGNSMVASAQSKVTSFKEAGEEVVKGEFGDFMGMKNFSFKKVGDFYYTLNAENADGSETEIGFFEDTMTRSVLGDIVCEYTKSVAKKSVTALADFVPGAKLFLHPMIEILFAGAKTPSDMKVSDCYKELNASLTKIQLQIEDFQKQYSEMTNMMALTAHHEKLYVIEDNTRQCVNEVVSLACSDDVLAQEKIKELILKWGNKNAAEAKTYIFRVKNGTGSMLYSSIVDAVAEQKFAWEHQGYDFRDEYRLHEYTMVAECAALLTAYAEYETSEGVGSIPAYVNSIIEQAQANAVVRDENNAICQIPGANHIKIDRNSFKMHSTEKPAAPNADGMYPTILDIPNGVSLRANVDWFVVPDANVHCYGPEKAKKNFEEAKNAMITVDEAEAIIKYYGNQRSFRNILVNEALVSDVKTPEDFPAVMPLWGAHVIVHDFYPGMKARVFGSAEIINEKMLYLDKTSQALDEFRYANETTCLNTFYGKLESVKCPRVFGVQVINRENGWKGGFAKK